MTCWLRDKRKAKISCACSVASQVITKLQSPQEGGILFVAQLAHLLCHMLTRPRFHSKLKERSESCKALPGLGIQDQVAKKTVPSSLAPGVITHPSLLWQCRLNHTESYCITLPRDCWRTLMPSTETSPGGGKGWDLETIMVEYWPPASQLTSFRFLTIKK